MQSRAERLRRLVERQGNVANREVAEALGISPATSHRLLRAAVASGVLQRFGAGRAARYRLAPIRRRFRRAGLEEDRAWQQIVRQIGPARALNAPLATSLRYAATEVINNAVDHSGGSWVDVAVEFQAARTTVVTVRDNGIGVFRRICEEFGYASPHEAIVQLEKGKLTSDPDRHSGEGLFFSSKAVSRFRLESQGVAWVVDGIVGDSGIGTSPVRKGTRVELAVVKGRTPPLSEVFAAYTDPETLRFDRTRTTIKLGALGANLISRAEAKRVAARLENFAHAVLDFSGVELVGQGFCDELFRVFARRHPEVALEPIGMGREVAFMVSRATGDSP